MKPDIFIAVATIVVVVVGGFVIFRGINTGLIPSDQYPSEISTSTNSEEMTVLNTVRTFVRKLSIIGAATSSTDLSTILKQQYATSVAPEFLSRWTSMSGNTFTWQGTTTPSFTQLEITSFGKNADGTYSVGGRIIAGMPSATSSYPVMFVLENRDGVWIITSVDPLQ